LFIPVAQLAKTPFRKLGFMLAPHRQSVRRCGSRIRFEPARQGLLQTHPRATGTHVPKMEQVIPARNHRLLASDPLNDSAVTPAGSGPYEAREAPTIRGCRAPEDRFCGSIRGVSGAEFGDRRRTGCSHGDLAAEAG
jgi:hypothetical protein